MRYTNVVAVIPTRERPTAGPIAEAIAPYVHKVLLIAHKADLPRQLAFDNIEVLPQKRPGLRNARNIGLQVAADLGAQYVLFSDDDVVFKPELLPQLFDIAHACPQTAIVSSAPRAFFYQLEIKEEEKRKPGGHPFILSPIGRQLAVYRLKTVQEIGDFRLETMEDLEWGMRAWSAGWAVVQAKKVDHGVSIPRLGPKKYGGQPVVERDEQMPKSCGYMQEQYAVPGGVLKHLRMREVVKDGPAFSIAYNWPEMTRRVRERWGEMGFADSRGREL